MQTHTLHQKDGKIVKILYDNEDSSIFDAYSWYVHTGGYIAGTRRGPGARQAEHVYLHRLIAKPPGKLIVDHINGNKADNRRSNLRCVPYSMNSLNQKNQLRRDNTHGFRGASQHKPTGLWQARLTVAGKRHNLGYFKTPAEAHAAYLRGVAIWSPASLLRGPV